MDGMSPHKSFLLAHSNLARLGLSVPLLPHPAPSVRRAGVASSQFFITVTPLSPFLAPDDVGSVPTSDRDESRSDNGRSFRAEVVRFHQKVLPPARSGVPQLAVCRTVDGLLCEVLPILEAKSWGSGLLYLTCRRLTLCLCLSGFVLNHRGGKHMDCGKVGRGAM